MGGAVSKITDDVLGLDPNGGGIYSTARDVLGDTVADDVLGMDPNGGGAVGAYNVAIPIAASYLAGGLFGGEGDVAAATADSTAPATTSSTLSQGMLDAANATSDPIAALNAQAGWTTADTAYLADIGATSDVIAQATANNAALESASSTSSVTQDMLDKANASDDPIASLNEQAGWTDTPSFFGSLPSLPSGLGSLLSPLAAGLTAKALLPKQEGVANSGLPGVATDTPFKDVNGQTPVAPSYANSSGLINSMQQGITSNLSRGYMSTLLTGGRGEDESKLNTSQVLLGA